MTASSRLVRVFISSTFRDFIEERDLLVKRVFPELRQRCRERFVEVLEVDLRWGITEEQSKSGETLRICLQEIDRCRPSAPVFFVGLLGERYGWIPPRDYFEQDVLEDPKLRWVKGHVGGKSVTELEILHGVLNNDQMRDKAFFYYRNDGYQDRHWDAIERYHAGHQTPIESTDFTNEKSPEPQVAVAKQRDLKRRVRDFSVRWEPNDYETPQDMADLVLEDLWAAINEVFPDSIVPDENARQRLEHDAFAQSRTKGYVPRPGLFEELDKILSGDTAIKVVLGESGVGKSALLAAWLKDREDKLPQKRFTHFIGGTGESGTAEGIVRRLMAAIREWGAVSEQIPEDLREAVRALPDWLAKAAETEKHGVLLVLDALNQLENEYDRSLWWLPKELPRGVKLIASTLPGPAEDALSERDFLNDAVSVPLLLNEEKRTIITSYLSTFSKGIATNLSDRLAGAPQCANPLFLRVVLDELRLRALHENLSHSLDRMLEANDPNELYLQVLKGLEEFDSDRPNLVRESLGYLAIARRGLTESELLQLLSVSESPSTSPLPRKIWSPLYLALEDSLVSRNGQLGFFHDYLRQAVEREYLDEDWERKNIHGRFGEVALAWDTDRFSPSLRNYGLAHGAQHLRLAGRHSNLVTLSCDMAFHEAQRKTSGLSAWTVQLLENALSSCAAQVSMGDRDWEETVEIVHVAHALAEQRALSGSGWIVDRLLEEAVDEIIIRRMIEVIPSLEQRSRFQLFVALLWKLASSNHLDAEQLIEETMRTFVSINVRERDWAEWIDERLLGWLVACLRKKVPSIDFLIHFSTASSGNSERMSDYVKKLEEQDEKKLCLDASMLSKPRLEMDSSSISRKIESKFLKKKAINPDDDLNALLDLAEQACALPADERDFRSFENALKRFEMIVGDQEDEALFKLATVRFLLGLEDAQDAWARALAASRHKETRYWRGRALERIAHIFARHGHFDQARRVASEIRDSTYLSEILLLIRLDRENVAFSVFCETCFQKQQDSSSGDEELQTSSGEAIQQTFSPDLKLEAEESLQKAIA